MANVGQKILNETNSINVADYTIGGRSLSEFLQAVNQVSASSYQNNAIYDRMRNDATISTVIDLYVSDALTVDPQRNRICWVEVESDDNSGTLASDFEEELHEFLYSHINIEEALRIITPRLVSYGAAPVQLNFISNVEDETWNLFKPNFNESEAINSENVATFDTFKQRKSTLLEDGKMADANVKKLLVEDKKFLKESEGSNLKEDDLVIKRKQYQGRWYIEYIPTNTQVSEIKAKGKTIAYINNDAENQIVLDGRDIAGFFHFTDSSSTTLYNIGDDGTYNLYYINTGTSYLKNASVAYQVLSSFEDLLLMHALTTAISYRIFSVEVGTLDTAETTDLLTDLKTRIRNNESIDLKKTIYSSSLTGLPLGDSIFVPVRNGLGALKIDSIKNDFGIKDIADFDYFRNKLATGLRVPSSLLGFSADQPSGIGAGSSLTRQDIRYSRVIDALKSELAQGIYQLVDKYLRATRNVYEYNKLPRFTIKFAKTNSADEVADLEAETQRMQAMDKVIESLKNLGIDLLKYKNTRKEVLNQFFGRAMSNAIEQDEKEGNTPVEDTEGVESTPVDITLTEPSGAAPTSDSDTGGGEETIGELGGGSVDSGLSMEPTIEV